MATVSKMDVQMSGQLIACGTTQSIAKIYNLTKRRQQSVLRFPSIGDITCMKYHPLRVFLATATSDGSLFAYGVPHV
uniref:WD_REPEATS_REGION domain-containing protein n=1 Tax=Steinernema glaseri TaxID=37863 RepID=A0A1I7ZCE2_9BILA